MPRDAVTVTDLAANAGTSEPAGTTITPANGANIANFGEGDSVVVRVTNTNGTDRTVTIKAGVNPPAVREGLGDLAVVVPASTGVKYLVLETARFCKADGSIDVDFETSMAGKICALRIPKAV